MTPTETAAAQWLRSVGRCCCVSGFSDRGCVIAGLGLCFGCRAIDLEDVARLAEIVVRDWGEPLAETVDRDSSQTRKAGFRRDVASQTRVGQHSGPRKRTLKARGAQRCCFRRHASDG